MEIPRSMLRRPLFLAALCAALLSGCWSGPESAEILIGTTPPGASCALTRLGQPIANVAPTPAIALVEPSASEINVRCSREGFEDAELTLPARQTGLSFGAIYGRPATDYPPRADIVLVPRPQGPASR